MILSESAAATRISSSWKGFKVRKIFSALEKVDSLTEYDQHSDHFDEAIKMNPALQHFISAWEAALLKTNTRLLNSLPGCSCWDCNPVENESWEYPDDREGSGGDWMWNEGGYNDW